MNPLQDRSDGEIGRHFLIVTVDPDEDEPYNHSGSVVCSGVTAACQAWFECRSCGAIVHESPEWAALVDAIYDDQEMHGIEHQMIDGMPMVRQPGACIGQVLEDSTDAANAASYSLESGRYPCTLKYGGDGYLEVLVSVGEHFSVPVYPTPTGPEDQNAATED